MNLNNARPQVQLNQDLQMLAHAHDFDHHAVFDIEQRVEGQLFPRLTISDLSMELTGPMADNPLLLQSSIFRMMATSNLPFKWLVGIDTVTGTRIGRTKADELWDDLMDRSDIAGGYAVPAQVPDCRRGAMIFFKKRQKPVARYPDLTIQGLELFERDFADSFEGQRKQVAALNASERSCLVWCACGKTSAEIGDILNLSEHTVNHYFTLAAQKLDANNRVHTVAKAIQLGLIDRSELS